MTTAESPAETLALSLIDRSISHDEVARHEWTAELAEELSMLSDDGAEDGSELSYWGGEGEGEWRVHLTGAPEGRTEDAWWSWHDQDNSRCSATTDEAEERCRAWVAGETTDGPAEDGQ